MTYYVDSVRALLLSDTPEAYNEMLLTLTTKWSQPFTQHYLSTVHAHLEHLAAWHQRPFGIELATTNTSESFNAQLKKLQNWSEAPVDAMVLVLYRLLQFQVAEISWGRAGLGNYVLCEGLELQPLSGEYFSSVLFVRRLLQ